MSLSMSDAARIMALEARVAALEARMVVLNELAAPESPRRGRPPKNLEERMKNQEHDPIDPYAGAQSRVGDMPDFTHLQINTNPNRQ